MTTENRTVVSLDLVRADGWFEQLCVEVPEFEQLCEMVGERFVAFAFIAGVRIAAISYNQEAPEASVVDFRLEDEGEVERMRLGEFREWLGGGLLSAREEVPELPPNPGAEDIRRLIGPRYVLLAPIFGVRLVELRYGGDGPPTVFLQHGSQTEEIPVKTLRDVLEDGVRSEVARARAAAPFSIDLGQVSVAAAANRERDFDKTIGLLGCWPGPLSVFLRTPQGQALGDQEKATLSRALGILGAAYAGKQQLEWAEEVLRLGVQWGQDTAATADLYVLLGELRMISGSPGEAIGLYQRAVAVGASAATVLPKLGECFADRQRHVAAIACLEQALAAGASPESVARLRSRIERALGDAFSSFESVMVRDVSTEH